MMPVRLTLFIVLVCWRCATESLVECPLQAAIEDELISPEKTHIHRLCGEAYFFRRWRPGLQRLSRCPVLHFGPEHTGRGILGGFIEKVGVLARQLAGDLDVRGFQGKTNIAIGVNRFFSVIQVNRIARLEGGRGTSAEAEYIAAALNILGHFGLFLSHSLSHTHEQKNSCYSEGFS